MVKPNIISEEAMTLVEVKDTLDKIKKRDRELTFRGNKTYEYVGQFTQELSSKKVAEIKKAIEDLNIPRLKDIHIAKIIDIYPATVEDLKVILQGYTITVKEDNLKKILKVL